MSTKKKKDGKKMVTMLLDLQEAMAFLIFLLSILVNHTKSGESKLSMEELSQLSKVMKTLEKFVIPHSYRISRKVLSGTKRPKGK